MEKLQWAVKVTAEWMDGHGEVRSTETEVRRASNEADARARYEALSDSIRSGHQRQHLWQRITRAELLSAPAVEWTTEEVTS